MIGLRDELLPKCAAASGLGAGLACEFDGNRACGQPGGMFERIEISAAEN